jgi:hypothetical protein
MPPSYDSQEHQIIATVIRDILQQVAPRWKCIRRDPDALDVGRNYLWKEILSRLDRFKKANGQLPRNLPGYCHLVLDRVARKFFGDRAKWGHRHKED